MYNFTVPMALMDYLPVFFFGVTAVLLLRDLYNKMFKGAYALLAAGCVNVFLAGFFIAFPIRSRITRPQAQIQPCSGTSASAGIARTCIT